MDTAQTRLTMSIRDAISATGIGKTSMYSLIADGSLRSVKIGKRRLIIYESLREFIADMESYGDLSTKQ
jgi:excisionase family DNA binding protein